MTKKLNCTLISQRFTVLLITLLMIIATTWTKPFASDKINEPWIIGSCSRVYLLKLEVQRPVGAGVWPSCLTGPIEWPGPPQRGQTVLRHGGPQAPKRNNCAEQENLAAFALEGWSIDQKNTPPSPKGVAGHPSGSLQSQNYLIAVQILCKLVQVGQDHNSQLQIRL